MGFISSLLGLSGNSGANYQANAPSQGDINNAASNTNQSIQQQQNFVNALTGQNGNVFNQQAGLANQLAAQAQGAGPNPALQQLAMTTGQNVSNQAALMAGQRGISANPGLAGRNIASQGAQIQQQGAGQAAMQAAQQQLAAQQNLAGLTGQMVNQQQGALGNLGQMGLTNQGQLLGAQSNANNVNASIANTNAQNQSGILGGLAGAAGMAFGIPGLGGNSNNNQNVNNINMNEVPNPAAPLSAQIGQFRGYAKGGEVGPQSMAAKFMSARNMKAGGHVPGKAKVSGDNKANDTVPAILSPKEIVLPRSVTMAPDAADKASKFVAAILSKGGRK